MVIVNDPAKPPTQDNIKQVVEIKFPPDKIDPRQNAAYTEIAGDENRLVVIGPQNCDCNQPEPNPTKIPVEQLGPAALLTGILCMLLTKQGPQDYVGSVPAITGTLFFNDEHLPEIREAICSCFDEYEGHPVAGSTQAHKGIKTVSWLTALSHKLVEEIGETGEIQAELPMDWFAFYDYGSGLVIQSGPTPEAAPTDQPKPARLVLPNRLFKAIRAPKFSLHYASRDGEPRIIGWAAEQWLKRFDIEEDELMAYKARLLDEPRLTKATTLPDRL
ncbi:hypothetical protein ALQ71_200253 [Pseudomonas coronafaciens pv. striafaciens]|nr:hypothetical protein ALQ71_200253 [Pseudomonas coronafaciens pv. striafaciens]